MRIPVGNIPDYVTASNLKALRRSMLKTQLRLGHGVEFFNIQKDGKKWVAFYYSGLSITSQNVGEELAE
jgi:hypothetical protein